MSKFTRFLLCIGCLSLSSAGLWGCRAGRLTDQLVITDGPQLNSGRMSAGLGALKMKNGNFVVVGGSNTEEPFVPITGPNTIEILKPPYTKWEYAGIDVPYRLAGRAYELPDGRLLVYTSEFIFNAASEELDPNKHAEDENTPVSGSVSAVIIDLNAKSVTPIYRAKGNEACGTPLKGNVAIMQRAFAYSMQLKNGKVLRIGAFHYHQKPNPIPKCEKNVCNYCVGDQCKDKICTKSSCKDEELTQYTCYEDKDCPKQWGQRDFIVSKVIEVYTPPNASNPLGSVQCQTMTAGRSSAAAIEIDNPQDPTQSKVLITGGWGPNGDGKNQSYFTTYYFYPDSPSLTLEPGPRMLYAREDHAMAKLEDGRVLVAGGTDGNEKSIRTTEIYDNKKQVFVHNQSMDASREDHITIRLGPLVLFIGGEVNDKADQIRNTAEAFNAISGAFIGSFFLYKRPEVGQLDEKRAGITDGSVLHIDPNTILLFGGQQGEQDREGEYVSFGQGTRRTLRIEYKP